MSATEQTTTANPTVAVIGWLRFAPERLQELLPQLQQVVAATREHDGCITYDVAIDPFEPGLLRFTELWPDQASLERHFKAPHMEPWRTAVRASGPLGRSFTVYEVSSSRPL